VTARVQDRDNGYRDLIQRLRAAREPVGVTVGVHEDVGNKPHGDGPATIGEVATYNEFGTSRIPRRSFVADWADENEAVNADLMRKLSAGLISGKVRSLDEAMRLFGEKAKGSMVRRMGEGIPPPNAPSTIARKGSSTPGIDSGEVRKAVDFKVTTKG
jgi:hypothetical protein